jgi:hypothetical protein
MSITTRDASGSVGVPETMIAQMGEIERNLFLKILKVTEAGGDAQGAGTV